ncbi:hypothetical protein [Litorisediminicola beolgyonensis]|uniref:DUF1127 domain-containing protein n=1 Tax=Litorisediminicola beolgyonensis TaxID=1173614 RepID=A0ABW3ZP92_9RHOB
MAYTTLTQAPAGRSRFAEFWRNLGDVYMRYAETKARLPQIRALEAKTDAELAEMGLTRDDIPRHVFRDLWYI